MISWAVFVSGEGSNLQNFIDLEPKLKNQKIVLVHSDRPCRGLQRAQAHKKEILLLDPKNPNYSEEVIAALQRVGANAIFLMGYMRILSPRFLSQWKHRLINLHPSLLPAYKGKDAVRRAYDAGEKVFGVSVHEVVAEVDSGRILRQLTCARVPEESFDDLMLRIHSLERKCVSEYLFDLDASR